MAGRDSNEDKTCVFWNIDHCPIPGGCRPHEITNFIKGALKNEGYLGDVSIWAYSDKPSVVDELSRDYRDAGISLRNLVSEGIEKLHEMSMDIFLFGLDNRAPSNVLVISKEDTVVFDVLRRMHSMGYRILVAQPENVDSNELSGITSMIWRWPSESDLLP
ncbi:hypothetical protein AALP_AA5G197300 [Arabis alpina]|uniref:NYN domain-containing protein n=1 Tax=Arabis alpina TaxID=50452 RepID=A0A087GY69_ARAAL|nr:hypothetical protein AALP_AA5G197300 [Arabis alpina]